MTIYIAGPMRRIPDHNRPAFERAARLLRYRGHAPVNPFDLHSAAETAQGDDPKMQRTFARRDLAALLDCDAIYLLTGWERSEGARAEHAVATWAHLQILYESTPPCPDTDEP